MLLYKRIIKQRNARRVPGRKGNQVLIHSHSTFDGKITPALLA